MTLVMTLVNFCSSSSSISTEKDSSVKSKTFLRQIPFAYPAEYLILSTVMLVRCFIGMLLKTFGFIYEDIVNLRTKPSTYKPKSHRIPYKLIKKQSHKQNHNTALFRLGLLAAINVVTQTPRLTLVSQKSFRSQMRKYRDRQGFLLPNKVPNEMLPRLRGLLQLTQCHELIAKNHILDIIVDTGCINSANPFKSDFVKNSMFKLAQPIEIEGVGGDIMVEYAGTLKWEFITSKGDIVKLYHMGHYAPALETTRLLSPQSYFKEKDKLGNLHYNMINASLN